MQRIWVGSAAMPGPHHYSRRINRQDQTFYIRQGKWIIGAIADGCSASPKSEAGAAELVHVAVQILCKLLGQGAIFSTMRSLYDQELRDFLFRKVASYPFGTQFLGNLTNNRDVDMGDMGNNLMYQAIAEMFQATLLACCIHEDSGGLVLIRGDGAVHLDGELTIFDYHDWPPYLSYDLAISGQGYDGNPNDLRSKTVMIPANFAQLGITTDGWPWNEPAANPFGHWRLKSFMTWLLDMNGSREKEGKNALTDQEGWLRYRGEHVDNLARKLVKNSIRPGESQPYFTDDISGIFIEREVTKDGPDLSD